MKLNDRMGNWAIIGEGMGPAGLDNVGRCSRGDFPKVCRKAFGVHDGRYLNEPVCVCIGADEMHAIWIADPFNIADKQVPFTASFSTQNS